MEDNTKKVILSWDEYQDLLKDGEALKLAKEELEKDCKERGLYVENIMYFYEQLTFFERSINPRLNIYSKDTVLEIAANEIDRLSNLVKSIVEEKNKEIARLKSRNLWQRIFNKD